MLCHRRTGPANSDVLGNAAGGLRAMNVRLYTTGYKEALPILRKAKDKKNK